MTHLISVLYFLLHYYIKQINDCIRFQLFSNKGKIQQTIKSVKDTILFQQSDQAQNKIRIILTYIRISYMQISQSALQQNKYYSHFIVSTIHYLKYNAHAFMILITNHKLDIAIQRLKTNFQKDNDDYSPKFIFQYKILFKIDYMIPHIYDS